MDIVSHTLSGIAAATVVASFSAKKLPAKALILVSGAAGGALPDADALSIVIASRVDIYTSNYWYSHHQFFHSILAGFLFTFLFFGISTIGWFYSLRKKSIFIFWKQKYPYLIAFFCGFMMHLLGDLPTPGGPWGGIKLFWPLRINIGGWGKIWWWNNYDLLLIILLCCFMNSILLVIKSILKKSFFRILLPIVISIIFVLSFLLIVYQVNRRSHSFAYQSHLKQQDFYKYEEKSLEIQKAILGNKLFYFISRVDSALIIYI
jgi:inner membrane protein